LRDVLVAEAGLFAVAPNASRGISWTGQFADHSHDNRQEKFPLKFLRINHSTYVGRFARLDRSHHCHP
jgi:hypothetical protein